MTPGDLLTPTMALDLAPSQGDGDSKPSASNVSDSGLRQPGVHEVLVFRPCACLPVASSIVHTIFFLGGGGVFRA